MNKQRAIVFMMLLSGGGLHVGAANARADSTADCEPIQMAKLLPTDLAAADAFGNRGIGFFGDTIVAGAPFSDLGGCCDNGAAWVFRRDGAGVWSEVDVLLPAEPLSGGGGMGDSDLDGDTAVIGAWGTVGTGSAYIFRESEDGEWVQVAHLQAGLGASFDEFGRFPKIDGDTVIVNDPWTVNQGLTYVFREDDDGNWNRIFTLAGPSTPAQAALFGISGIDGDTIMRAKPHINASLIPTGPGSVSVYQEGPPSFWTFVGDLTASDGEFGDAFGRVVDIQGDVAAIGANWDDVDGMTRAGSVYIFRRNERGTWNEVAKVIASDASVQGWFGSDVSLASDDLLVVGSWNNNGVNVFRDQGGDDWVEVGIIESPVGGNDLFGSFVKANGNELAVGAIQDDEVAPDAGAVYVFDLNCVSCAADLDGDGAVGFADLVSLLADWGESRSAADLDGSGTVDFSDLLQLLAAWGPC